MLHRRVVLQPVIEIGVAQGQDVRFAVPSGSAKSGLAWLNVMKNGSAGTVTVDILGATSMDLDPATGSNSFWLKLKTPGIAVGAGAVGGLKGVLSEIPDFIRWNVTGSPVTFQFEIVLYLYDT